MFVFIDDYFIIAEGCYFDIERFKRKYFIHALFLTENVNVNMNFLLFI